MWEANGCSPRNRRVPECRVRPYEPRDQAALCNICYATGLMGESIDPLACYTYWDKWRNYMVYQMVFSLSHRCNDTYVK